MSEVNLDSGILSFRVFCRLNIHEHYYIPCLPVSLRRATVAQFRNGDDKQHYCSNTMWKRKHSILSSLSFRSSQCGIRLVRKENKCKRFGTQNLSRDTLLKLFEFKNGQSTVTLICTQYLWCASDYSKSFIFINILNLTKFLKFEYYYFLVI